jgi:hypothetical protein
MRKAEGDVFDRIEQLCNIERLPFQSVDLNDIELRAVQVCTLCGKRTFDNVPMFRIKNRADTKIVVVHMTCLMDRFFPELPVSVVKSDYD